MEKRKVVIIGDGAVGSTCAYTLLLKNTVNEIVLIDVNKNKAQGDVLDLYHGMSFVSPKTIYAGEYTDVKDADMVVITAGVAQKEGETRMDLLKRNIKVFDDITNQLQPYLEEDCVILVVTNPVDVLSYYTYQKLGIASNRVIGSGTVLDTARLKAAISENTHIDPRNVHTYVVGEHGDSEVPVFSLTSIGGLSLSDYCSKNGGCLEDGITMLDTLHQSVKDAAYQIIEKKGATYYAVALCVNRIVEAILNNQNSILTVSTYVPSALNGEIQDVYMSLPCIIAHEGVKQVIEPNYNEEEKKKMILSAQAIQKQIKTIR